MNQTRNEENLNCVEACHKTSDNYTKEATKQEFLGKATDEKISVSKLAHHIGWTQLTHCDQEPVVENCYVGDLLSWVMSKARENDVWVTVMGNINAVAVAVLTDVSAIVLADNAPLDAEAKEKALTQGVLIYQTPDNAFDTAIKIYKELKK